MISIPDKINKIRELMIQRGIAVYVIPTADYHQSEYISEYFKVREYMSGFTGSAGTLIISMNEAVLYTDGRYFIQAEKELEGSGIRLMKMGERGVISQNKYIENCCKDGGTVGFDGKIVAADYALKLGEKVEINANYDLVSHIWEGRPALSGKWAYVLDERYCGESAGNKINRVRTVMDKAGADYHIISSLDDIAWLFNIRGNDIAYNPVVLSYAILKKDGGTIYFHRNAVTDEIKEHFDKLNINIKEYNEFYNDIENLEGKVMMDCHNVNYATFMRVGQDRAIDMENPTTLMKAIKNETEIDNLRKAHIMDGVAVTRFMYWLKNELKDEEAEITEISAATVLEEFRKEYDSYIEPSFETISAYGANAAMMHYSASEENNDTLQRKGFLLVDSGGQYFEGTTDITRTFALGELSSDEKKHFTLVAVSMLRLANTRFLYGCKGINLDIIAREPLWKLGIDYKCGTGHGVGYLLNVHEAPNGFRWRSVPERSDGCVLEAGMVTTDEPGVYFENKYGIRTENELLCKEIETNEYGTFMGFDMLTMVPIDLDAINVEYLDKSDIQNLNNYHQMVYNTIAPFLNEDEKIWLKEYTRAL